MGEHRLKATSCNMSGGDVPLNSDARFAMPQLMYGVMQHDYLGGL